jgi:Tol biopolymer transport system component
MIYCTQCGKENSVTQNFCGVCGSKLENEPDFILCPTCGNKNLNDAQNCIECGINIHWAIEKSSQTSSQVDENQEHTKPDVSIASINKNQSQDISRTKRSRSIPPPSPLINGRRTAIIVIILGTLLFFTNPNKQQHEQAIAGHIIKIVKLALNDATSSIMGETNDSSVGIDLGFIGGIAGGFIENFAEKYITDALGELNIFQYHNYVFFSTATFSVKMDFITDNVITFGIFGKAFIITPIDEWFNFEEFYQEAFEFLGPWVPEEITDVIIGISETGSTPSTNNQFPIEKTEEPIVYKTSVPPPYPTLTPGPTITPKVIALPDSRNENAWQQGKIIFLKRNGSGHTIYMVGDGNWNTPQLIYAPVDPVNIQAPVISADGQRISYYLFENGIPRSYTIDTQTDAKPIVFGSCSGPSWSPIGDQIICRTRRRFELRDATTGVINRSIELTENGIIPMWSPNGKEIVYATYYEDKTEIWSLEINTEIQIPLASSGSENYTPSWSPDGEWIAYQSKQNSSNSEIWIMRRDGSQKQQITNTENDGWSRAPTWSPDGNWIAFVSNQTNSNDTPYGEVYVVNVKSGEIMKITSENGSVYEWRVSWGP